MAFSPGDQRVHPGGSGIELQAEIKQSGPWRKDTQEEGGRRGRCGEVTEDGTRMKGSQ